MNKYKKFLLVFFLLLTTLIYADTVWARLLPRFRAGGKSTSVSSGIGVSVKLRSDRRALNLSLSNLSKVRGVTYTLIYQTDGRDEGVSGSIDSTAGNSVSRELLFGTCSAGVCRYHVGITNMKLEVLTTLLNGKKTLRRFKIRP